MAPSSALTVIAWIEVALAILVLAFVAIGYGIQESDDVWALGFSTIVLTGPAALAVFLSKSEAKHLVIGAILLVSFWPLILIGLFLFA
jgi:hypothetical protein